MTIDVTALLVDLKARVTTHPPPNDWESNEPTLHQRDTLAALLYATARRYNSLLQETSAQQPTRPPFPFLRLPREVRDAIYIHALRTPSFHINIESPDARFPPCTALFANPHKPASPGLLLVNKQIHAEAADTLYGASNTFRFYTPDAMRVFDSRIGAANCARVRRISICSLFPNTYVEDAKTVEWYSRHTERLRHRTMGLITPNSTPAAWCMALKTSRFECVTWFGVEADKLGWQAPLGKMRMPLFLKDAIVKFWEKGRGAEERIPMRVDLLGFRDEDKSVFPDGWDVVLEEWDKYKKIADKVRMEIARAQ
ncbi:unnamed protein product [Periconia digitata]|uniref:Uncharacterized protein n=1 Tax=Periconia digitata TaxID=1303443 RepID=A0A9W4UPM3_9PLEO|nr:unnamed protein product [Periconia digitata]